MRRVIRATALVAALFGLLVVGPMPSASAQTEPDPVPCDPATETCEEPPPCDPAVDVCEEPPPCDPATDACEPAPCDPATETCHGECVDGGGATGGGDGTTDGSGTDGSDGGTVTDGTIDPATDGGATDGSATDGSATDGAVIEPIPCEETGGCDSADLTCGAVEPPTTAPDDPDCVFEYDPDTGHGSCTHDELHCEWTPIDDGSGLGDLACVMAVQIVRDVPTADVATPAPAALPATGSDVWPLVELAVLLLVVGGSLHAATRPRVVPAPLHLKRD